MEKNSNMNNYINDELIPAINWSSTPEAQTFAQEHPALAPFVNADPKEDIECCYIISLVKNNIAVVLYIGEAKRKGRMIVHCKHLAESPEEYFGIAPSEIKYIRIELEKELLFDPKKRKLHELELRSELSPVLNPTYLGDSCIPRSERYKAVHSYYNDPNKLSERIGFITEKALFMYDLHAYLRDKTPCCDYKDLDIPYGLETRIREYLKSMPKAERSAFIQNLANNLGEAFFITEATTVKLLSRLLAEDPYDSIELMKFSLRMQLAQRQELLEILETIE